MGFCRLCGKTRKDAANRRYWGAARKARYAPARKVKDAPDWEGLKRGL
jgi:hypothetical protein